MRKKELKNTNGELKKLRNEISKILGSYFRKPDTTLAVAERTCLMLHRAIDETLVNCFADNGKMYVSRPLISARMPSEQWIENRVKRFSNRATSNLTEKQVIAIIKLLVDDIPKELYVDKPPASN